MLQIIVTFTNGSTTTIDCDKMMKALQYKDNEIIGMFMEKDKPKDPRCKWQPFFMINLRYVMSIRRTEFSGDTR